MAKKNGFCSPSLAPVSLTPAQKNQATSEGSLKHVNRWALLKYLLITWISSFFFHLFFSLWLVFDLGVKVIHFFESGK
jgi:hypothetical protein